MNITARRLLALCASLTLAVAFSTSTAHAASCSIGNSGVSYNRDGDGARFSALQSMRGMNCPSARYVLNKWLRRKFERGYSNTIPTSFYDGYVTWRCYKRTGTRWQCDEYDSGTSFRFTAYML